MLECCNIELIFGQNYAFSINFFFLQYEKPIAMYAFLAYIEKTIIRNKVIWEYEVFIDEVTIKLVVPVVMEVLLLDQISDDDAAELGSLR